MEKLVNRIIAANEAYRKGEPIMSDAEYDSLLVELEIYDRNHPLLNKVGLEIGVEDSRKSQLPIPMFSLDKLKSGEELVKWLMKLPLSLDSILVITPKYDGISICVDETNGMCWTRGDGREGQRSDKHYKVMGDFVHMVDLKLPVITFGEAIMPISDFDANYKQTYSNPRNMVAGLFNKDIPTPELKHVHYVRYGINYPQLDKLDLLGHCWEFGKGVKYISISVREVLKRAEGKGSDKWLDKIYKDFLGLGYQIDGLVIDINESGIRSKLGREKNGNPAYSRAIKLPTWTREQICKVTGIEWGIGKNGDSKPVICIEPTDFDGVTVERVTGYNARYIIDNWIHPGATIAVIRSGDVIPKHLRTVSWSTKEMGVLNTSIRICPSCGEVGEWDGNEVNLVCTNSLCPEMNISKLVHFFSSMGYENFGKPSIKQLYYKGYNTAESILNIQPEDLIQLPGWGESSVNTLLKEFKRVEKEKVVLAKLLHSLDIFRGKIGEKTCQTIFDDLGYKYLQDLMRWVDAETSISVIERLVNINGVGLNTAEVFLDGLKKYYPYYESFLYLTKDLIVQEQFAGEFAGLSFCFTGFRDESIEEFIKQQGGEIVSGVSKNLTYLVTKDKFYKVTGKIQKAYELGTEIITYEQVLKMVGR